MECFSIYSHLVKKNFKNTFPLDHIINFFLDHPVGIDIFLDIFIPNKSLLELMISLYFSQVVVVSESFIDKKSLARHRLINEVLKEVNFYSKKIINIYQFIVIILPKKIISTYFLKILFAQNKVLKKRARLLTMGQIVSIFRQTGVLHFKEPGQNLVRRSHQSFMSYKRY